MNIVLRFRTARSMFIIIKTEHAQKLTYRLRHHLLTEFSCILFSPSTCCMLPLDLQKLFIGTSQFDTVPHFLYAYWDSGEVIYINIFFQLTLHWDLVVTVLPCTESHFRLNFAKFKKLLSHCKLGFLEFFDKLA